MSEDHGFSGQVAGLSVGLGLRVHVRTWFSESQLGFGLLQVVNDCSSAGVSIALVFLGYWGSQHFEDG